MYTYAYTHIYTYFSEIYYLLCILCLMHTSNACLKRSLRYLRICALLAFVCLGACERGNCNFCCCFCCCCYCGICSMVKLQVWALSTRMCAMNSMLRTWRMLQYAHYVSPDPQSRQLNSINNTNNQNADSNSNHTATCVKLTNAVGATRMLTEYGEHHVIAYTTCLSAN